MQIDYKIKAFCDLLVSLNWQFSIKKIDNISLIKLTNRILYEDVIEINILKNYNSPDFSRQLFSTLDKAIQLDERIKEKQQTYALIAFLNNYQKQFSKTKKDWIIPEPNSKYTDNEIPSLYVP